MATDYLGFDLPQIAGEAANFQHNIIANKSAQMDLDQQTAFNQRLQQMDPNNPRASLPGLIQADPNHAQALVSMLSKLTATDQAQKAAQVEDMGRKAMFVDSLPEDQKPAGYQYVYSQLPDSVKVHLPAQYDQTAALAVKQAIYNATAVRDFNANKTKLTVQDGKNQLYADRTNALANRGNAVGGQSSATPANPSVPDDITDSGQDDNGYNTLADDKNTFAPYPGSNGAPPAAATPDKIADPAIAEYNKNLQNGDPPAVAKAKADAKYPVAGAGNVFTNKPNIAPASTPSQDAPIQKLKTDRLTPEKIKAIQKFYSGN